MSAQPIGIRLSNVHSLLSIEWEDGHRCELLLSELRDACPCALCGDSERQTANAASLENRKNYSSGDQREKVEYMYQMGNYALKIIWGDGHASGIFSWEMLRQLCADARRISGESGE